MSRLLSAKFAGLVGLVFLASGCDWLPTQPAQSSVTVRLPPPHTPTPGFKAVADNRNGL